MYVLLLHIKFWNSACTITFQRCTCFFVLLGIPNDLIKMCKCELHLTFFIRKLGTSSSLDMVQYVISHHTEQLIRNAVTYVPLRTHCCNIYNSDNIHIYSVQVPSKWINTLNLNEWIREDEKVGGGWGSSDRHYI
jgi:hypothetical protein